MSNQLGSLHDFASLSGSEKKLVQLAWLGAKHAAEHNLCFHSNFPVGAAILARNAKGKLKQFCGCNVENRWFNATICAERNAATTAVMEGYTKFEKVAVVCQKFPGGPPCGLCRQVLVQFGRDADVLNIVDHDSNVRIFKASELLPATIAELRRYEQLTPHGQRLIDLLQRLKKRSHVPYSKNPRSALFVAENDTGLRRVFQGVSDDNASYGGSALAETVAMRSARTAGYSRDVSLWTSVENPCDWNPLDGEGLQVLREFGSVAKVVLVGSNGSSAHSSLAELLPDSFGPESL